MKRTVSLVLTMAVAVFGMATMRAADGAEEAVFTEVTGFATKTGFRGIVAWEADQPVLARVRYGTSPTALTLSTAQLAPQADTAGMVVIGFVAGFGPAPGDTIYYRVEDQLSGGVSAIQSFEAKNAYNDWNGSTYTIDVVMQLDTQSLPAEVPADLALQDIAAGANVWAERLYDSLDGFARVGNVLITDTQLDQAANVPFQTLDGTCPSNQSNMADFLFESAPPLDSHTFGGFAVNQYCTQIYIGREGWLGSHWLDDLSLGYVMAHEGGHYFFNAPDLYPQTGAGGCRNLAWDGSLMHNTGGYTGSRWELTELDRNPTLTPCDHGGSPWSWDALRERYTNVPLNPTGPIDHMVDTDAKGNEDGGALNIMILDRQPGSSTLTAYVPDDSFTALPAGSQRKYYTGGTGDGGLLCSGWMSPSTGGTCFELTGSETSIHVTIDDEAPWDVGGSWRFENAAGTALSSGVMCGDATLPVPAGATEFLVFLGEARGAERCLNAGETSVGAATVGAVVMAIA